MAQTVKKNIHLQCGRPVFDPCVGKIPWRRKWQSTPVLLPGKFHGRRSLVATVHGVAKSQTRLRDFTHAACSLSNWLLSPSNMWLSFLPLFSMAWWLIYSMLNNIPLSGFVCPVHLLKDISVASEFGQSWIKWLLTLGAQGFVVDVSFQLLWVNTKERNY